MRGRLNDFILCRNERGGERGAWPRARPGAGRTRAGRHNQRPKHCRGERCWPAQAAMEAACAWECAFTAPIAIPAVSICTLTCMLCGAHKLPQQPLWQACAQSNLRIVSAECQRTKALFVLEREKILAPTRLAACVRDRALRTLALTGAWCVGVQGRWQCLLLLYEYILAQFSLRMVRTVRWHLTAFLPGRPGTDSPVAVHWAWLLALHAGLWLFLKEPKGLHGRAASLSTYAPNAIAADGPCAASYDTLLATQRWLLCMTLAGLALLGLCWCI